MSNSAPFWYILEEVSEINNSINNPYQSSYEYDPSGNRTRMVKNNLEYLYTYNNANQLTQEQLNGPATTSIAVIGSITDANSIKSFTINGSAVTLDGNNFNSQIVLSSGQNPIILTATDAAGNTAVKTIQVTYNSNQQILYAYDNNGNLISKQSSNQTLNLGYDYENRLSSVITSPAQQGEASYTYNGEGKRISSTNGSTTTNYLYDSLDVVLELNGSNDPVAAYLRNPYTAGGIGGIISSQQGTNPEVYYGYDGLGSVANLSDTTGANIQSYSYDAFGNIIAETGSTTNSNKFLTKEMDLSGFIYFGARYYDPKIGRFITQDPLGMVDGTNVYLYVNNDPVNLVDLWGLCKKLWWEKLREGEYHGTGFGQSAAEWYAQQQIATGNPLWAIPGSIASLWTPETYQTTGWTFIAAYGFNNMFVEGAPKWAHYEHARGPHKYPHIQLGDSIRTKIPKIVVDIFRKKISNLLL